MTCLCELNAIEQTVSACRTTVVKEAWEHGHELTVHGLMYGLGDGLLRDLRIAISSAVEIGERREAALLARAREWSDPAG